MRTEHHSGEEWLSATELGEWLGIGRSKAYALLREEIPAHRIGKSTLRVRRDDVEAWLQSNRHPNRASDNPERKFPS
jgi:excisionase family DNA binding protein